jgi:hypothetical protein
VKFYAGNIGSKAAVEWIIENGWGRFITAVDWKNPVEGLDWALDNGAYSFWVQGKEWDARPLLSAIEKMRGQKAPDWIVLPDRVGLGYRSYVFSSNFLWQKKYQDLAVPLYLAVQDGLKPSMIWDHDLDLLGGIFVGGTMKWKLRESEKWVNWAHDLGIPCHIGRAGTVKKCLWAQRIGADSVDSTSPCRKWRIKFPQLKQAMMNQLCVTGVID